MLQGFIRSNKTLFVLLLIYAATSLVHFIHNAEFLADYPNLPQTWTRTGVYLAWVSMTSLGLAGCIFFAYGLRRVGLLTLGIYAALGMDSLGHYVVARISEHTLTMNLTIMLEVTAALLVFLVVCRELLASFARQSV